MNSIIPLAQDLLAAFAIVSHVSATWSQTTAANYYGAGLLPARVGPGHKANAQRGKSQMTWAEACESFCFIAPDAPFTR